MHTSVLKEPVRSFFEAVQIINWIFKSIFMRLGIDHTQKILLGPEGISDLRTNLETSTKCAETSRLLFLHLHLDNWFLKQR